MLQHERQNEILHILKNQSSATVEEIAAKIFVSPSTARRDVIALEEKGFVCRLYGGVMLAEYKNESIPVTLREDSFSAQKEEVARRAAAEIGHGAVVFADGSSTVRRVFKYVEADGVTVVTNNTRIFEEYGNQKKLTLYATGGKYNTRNHVFLGEGALRTIRQFHADIFLFSSQGLTEEGVFDVSEEETALRREMLYHADRRIFLCDASKLGVCKTHRLCTLDEIDKIICDTPLPWEIPQGEPKYDD